MSRNIVSDHMTDLCNFILKENRKVTFVGIINERGIVEECRCSASIIDKLPRERKEMFFVEYALRHRMRKEFDEELGRVGYTYAERERRSLFSFPISNHLFLIVACKPQINPKTFAQKILGSIKSYA